MTDNCQVCKGERGGVRGNENVIDGIVLCDYCTADPYVRRAFTLRLPPPDYERRLYETLRDAPFPAEPGEREGHDDSDLVRLATDYDAWYCERAEALSAEPTEPTANLKGDHE